MARQHDNLSLTGVERHFGDDDIIVSKTDLKGRMTYVNHTFIDISGYVEPELIGQPHSLIRHPHMPRCIFKLLWETLQAKRELFAYVVNRCKNGDHYWVFAHVTPSLDSAGNIRGYHSNRRVPDRRVIDQVITPLYQQLLAEEKKHGDRAGFDASWALLNRIVAEKGMEYEQLIFAL